MAPLNTLDVIRQVREDGLRRAVKPVLSLSVMAAALGFAVWIIIEDMRGISLHQIWLGIHGLSTAALVMGLVLTVISYLFLIFYDRLGARYAEVCVSWRQTAIASFCSNTLAHNLGCPSITGPAVRYRLYRSWGASRLQILSIIGFCSLTCLIGLVALGSVVMLAQPRLLARLLHLPVMLLYIASAMCFAAIALYMIFCRSGLALRFGNNRMCLPRWKLAFGQILFGMAEISCTAAIFWAFLGNVHFHAGSLNFLGFVAIYLAGYFAGLFASTPGGLGVFDGFMLLALTPFFAVAQIFGALILFRFCYYFIPFLGAGALFCGHEVKLFGLRSGGAEEAPPGAPIEG